MISVLTLTYKRHHLLEEAIESFLLQGESDNEMVIINDNPKVEYVFDHPRVRILNCKERFSSVGKKLEWGFSQCKFDYMYRLDDDDLLAPDALYNSRQHIENNPGYDIYRGKSMYFFSENMFYGEGGSVNNGNIYTKQYIDRISIPDKSIGEDSDITFGNNSKIYTIPFPTMIYRWGMGTLHISGLGEQPNDVVLDQADRVLNNKEGTIILEPKFKEDYFDKLKKPPK